MLILRLFPASIRRAFSLIGYRFRALFENTPFFFFGVVLSLAVVFRAGVGLYRDAAAEEKMAVSPSPEVSAPTSSAPAVSTAESSPSTPASTSTSREPIGAPARVAPKTRGHGRRGSTLHP